MDFSPVQIGIVLLIVLIVFGPSRLPELGKSMGRGIREFKDSITGGDDDRDEIEPGPATATATANDPVETPAAAATSDPVEGEVVSDNKA